MHIYYFMYTTYKWKIRNQSNVNRLSFQSEEILACCLGMLDLHKVPMDFTLTRTRRYGCFAGQLLAPPKGFG